MKKNELFNPLSELNYLFDIICDLTPNKTYHTYDATKKDSFEPVILKELPIEKYFIFQKMTTLWNPYRSNIYTVFPFENSFFVVTEKIYGNTLYDYICEHNFDNGQLFTEEEIYNIILQVCEGIKDLHKCGIILKDLSPSNIVYNSKTNIIKLIDFGESRIHTSEHRSDTHVVGTHGYCAPDMLDYRQSDHRADIYSIGCILNCLLTGCSPDKKLYHGTLYFSKIIKKCLNSDRNKRYKNATQLQNALFYYRNHQEHCTTLFIINLSPFGNLFFYTYIHKGPYIFITNFADTKDVYTEMFEHTYDEMNILEPLIDTFLNHRNHPVSQAHDIGQIQNCYKENHMNSDLAEISKKQITILYYTNIINGIFNYIGNSIMVFVLPFIITFGIIYLLIYVFT